jgi:hypothetical protein
MVYPKATEVKKTIDNGNITQGKKRKRSGGKIKCGVLAVESTSRQVLEALVTKRW